MRIKIHAPAPSYAVSSIHSIARAIKSSCSYNGKNWRSDYDRSGNIDMWIEDSTAEEVAIILKDAAEELELTERDFGKDFLRYDAAKADVEDE